MSLRWKGPGISDFIAELAESSTVTRRESKKVMREGAKQILKASQDGAPIDDGELEQAHELAVVRLAKDNIDLEITVGGMVGDVDVSEYAWVMHEGDYQLGPRSREKQMRSDREVGPKFLERAVDEHEDELIRAVADTLPGS